MPQAQMVAFAMVKGGVPADEWEDCVGYREAAPDASRARFIVVDGATEAFDAVRWVRQLVHGFLELRPPATVHIGRQELLNWIDVMQQRWQDESPNRFDSIFAERKFRESGSFATFLGCEIDALHTLQPRWRAAALGDVVLFHVRDERTVATFPDLGPDDFGINPDGVFTHPRARSRMERALREQSGELRVGDLLFAASDALAEWIVRRRTTGESHLWNVLADLDDGGQFTHLVSAERRCGRLKNDDVTLLRAEITPGDPDFLVLGL
jgi:hypothetical protein